MKEKAVFSSLLILFLFTLINAETFFKIDYNGVRDSIEIEAIDSIEYVDMGILVSIVKATSHLKKTQEEMRIESSLNYVILSLNSPYFRSGGNIYKMPYTPIQKDEQVLFPVQAIKEVMSYVLPSNTEFSEYGVKIKDKSALKEILTKDNTIKLVFNARPAFTYEKTLRDIILFLQACSIDEKKFKIRSNDGLIRVVEPINDIKESTMIITFAPEMQIDKVEGKGDTLLIIMKKRENSGTNNNVIRIKTIILDAGHGGKDPGAVGPTGLKEKTATLDITVRLKELILSQYKDIKVILTRSDDSFVSLKDRTMLANKYKDAIFISIHCNASYNKNAKGAETYFLSEAKTDEARAVEARENASLAFDIPDDEKNGLDFILWDLAQNEFLKESSHMAELIQGEFEKNCSNPRGLNQAGFYVLKGNYMPAVLVECAFISNKEEEALLKTKDFRTKIAKNIFNGLKNFLDDNEKKSK